MVGCKWPCTKAGDMVDCGFVNRRKEADSFKLNSAILAKMIG